MLLEHPPVFTIGRRGGSDHLLVSKEVLSQEGIALFETSRGGDITYHGPGQLVGYPILDLRRHGQDLHGYLRRLEEVLILTLGEYGIAAGRLPGYTGVWVGDEKVAAIGVAVKRWVTMHGFALNINPQMRHFSMIVPCGIRDHGVTSLSRLLGRPVDADEVRGRVAERFEEIFGLSFEEVALERIPA